MKKAKGLKKIFSVLIILLLIITVLGFENSSKASAAVKSSKSKETYINATDTNLYLGEGGQEYFDFNIKKTFKNKVKSYTWSVKTEKGNPEAIKLDKKTGIVMAKKSGTAYINCKITFTNGKTLNSEAKVTVHNNIKEVAISNPPDNNRIIMGGKTDFDSEILDTAAGKNVPTQGITRWEITEDLAEVKSVTDDGVVEPAKEGSFKIRAVCFESLSKYNLWLSDKKLDSSCITAASEWLTIKVIAEHNIASKGGLATATNQEELDKLLAEEDVSEITLSTQEAITITIPEGNYSTKSFVVDAKSANVINKGLFNKISIIAVKDSSWREYAKGNSFHIKSNNPINFIVEASYEVKELVMEATGGYLSLENKGLIKRIRMLQSSQLHVSGSTNKTQVEVENTARASAITSSVPLNLLVNADTRITLKPGAEGTEITKVSKSITINITNSTKEQVVFKTYMWYDQTINSGTVFTSQSTENSILNNIQIPVATSITVFINGKAINLYGDELKIIKNTVVDYIMVSMSEGVKLVEKSKGSAQEEKSENPSANLFASGWSAKFGNINLVNGDESISTIIIIPIEKNGTFDKAGTYHIVIPNGSLKDQEGNVNAVISIKIIVTES